VVVGCSKRGKKSSPANPCLCRRKRVARFPRHTKTRQRASASGEQQPAELEADASSYDQPEAPLLCKALQEPRSGRSSLSAHVGMNSVCVAIATERQEDAEAAFLLHGGMAQQLPRFPHSLHSRAACAKSNAQLQHRWRFRLREHTGRRSVPVSRF
jgi:hypothetical protein